MQFGPYTFKNFRSFNFRSFMGRDGYGLSFSLHKGGHRFAYYTDDGNGGCGTVLPYPEKPKDSAHDECVRVV